MGRALMSRLLILTAVVLFSGHLPLASNDTAPQVPTRPRLVEIQIDGLSPLLVDALLDPDDPAKLARLPDPEGFRRAVQMFRHYTGRQDLLPNLRHYFYEQGARADNMFSATMTLSAVAWSVIKTGQPSVIKRHMTFSRNNGYMRGHLDGFRDGLDIVTGHSRKTSALWELDQVGVSLLSDGFNPLRRYEIPQMFYRLPPGDYLRDWGKTYATTGESLSDPWAIVRGHFKRRVEGIEYSDFNEEFLADHVAKKILERDFGGEESYDYLTVFFSIDHQHHVDPNPENLVHRMIRLDRRIGRIFRAVERSQRREQTLVVVLSDHGAEYLPGAINLAFPITRVFRTRLFGGHTVATLMAEDSAHALTTPIKGIDYPRVYEGPFSPYGKAAREKGAKGYVTAAIDNFGNARAEVHLRNNDLNRLHLLLQARHRPLDEEQQGRWRTLFRRTVADVWTWLGPELANYRAYHYGSLAWARNLRQRTDYYWRDIGNRLKAEAERDAPQLKALNRLAELCQAVDPVAWLRDNNPSIPDLIPKKYLGPRNSVYQLTRYTIGLDDNLKWIEETVDPRGNRVPMDYISILSNYRAPNQPPSHERNPIDLVVSSLPVEPIRAALIVRGWLQAGIELRQVNWVVSTAKHSLRKGGQALTLEATDGRIRYLPILNLRQDAEGRFTFAVHNQLDPLGLFYDPEFSSPTGEPAFVWLERFHTPQEWLEAAHDTYYGVAPLIIGDIAGVHTEAFIDNPAFQRRLDGFPNEEARAQYLRGLKWKYAANQPDLLLWSSYLWNFSSKNHTPGGGHGGLTPLVTRTSFLLWGGKDFQLPTGYAIKDYATTLDIVPTLAQLLGMLDGEGRLTRQEGAVRDHPFFTLPGTPLLEPTGTFATRQKPAGAAPTD